MHRFKLLDIPDENERIDDPSECLSLPEDFRKVMKEYPFVYLDEEDEEEEEVSGMAARGSYNIFKRSAKTAGFKKKESKKLEYVKGVEFLAQE